MIEIYNDLQAHPKNFAKSFPFPTNLPLRVFQNISVSFYNHNHLNLFLSAPV